MHLKVRAQGVPSFEVAGPPQSKAFKGVTAMDQKALHKARSNLPVGTEQSTDLAKEHDEAEEGELSAPGASLCPPQCAGHRLLLPNLVFYKLAVYWRIWLSPGALSVRNISQYLVLVLLERTHGPPVLIRWHVFYFCARVRGE